MLIEMNVFISALKEMAMLMFNLSHNFQSSPFVHFICESVLIGKVITVSFLILKGVFKKLSSDSLSTNVGSDCRFIIDESFYNWNDVSILCSNIHN